MPRLRLRVGAKFSLAVGLLLPAILVVAVLGSFGLSRLNTKVQTLYADNQLTTQRTADLAGALDDVDESALQLIPTLRVEEQARLNAELDQALIPRVHQAVADLRRSFVREPRSLERLDRIEAGLARFLRLRRSGAYDATSGDAKAVAADAALAAQTGRIPDEATTVAEQLRADEVRQAGLAEQSATNVYTSARRMLLAGVVVSLFLGLGIVLALIRNLVPRIQGYSRFAADIAARRPTPELRPSGRDELNELGEALNDMVRQRQLTDRLNEAEAEYVETMQVTETEEEAQELVQRRLSGRCRAALPSCFVVTTAPTGLSPRRPVRQRPRYPADGCGTALMPCTAVRTAAPGKVRPGAAARLHGVRRPQRDLDLRAAARRR